MLTLRRLIALAFTLAILGTTAWAFDARDDEYQRVIEIQQVDDFSDDVDVPDADDFDDDDDDGIDFD